MTNNTLRIAIARAIRGADPVPIGDGIQYEAAVYPLEAADAVLKVLADPPAEVVVQVAQALCPDLWGGILQALPHVTQCHGEGWNSALRRAQDERLGTVQAVLAALVGGGQS